MPSPSNIINGGVSMSMSITIQSHAKEVLEAMKEQLALGLDSVGEKMEKFAKGSCPTDTGRLKDSITYVTATSQGSAGPRAQSGDSTPKGTPEEFEVQVGTNVEYAKYVEYGDKYHHDSGKAHFLRDAAANHTSTYKKILEAALK